VLAQIRYNAEDQIEKHCTRTQEHSAYGSLYRAVPRSVQGFLAVTGAFTCPPAPAGIMGP
jgi:hypothetical protein